MCSIGRTELEIEMYTANRYYPQNQYQEAISTVNGAKQCSQPTIWKFVNATNPLTHSEAANNIF